MTALRSLAALASFIVNFVALFVTLVLGLAGLFTAIIALLCVIALVTPVALVVFVPLMCASVMLAPVSLISRGDFSLCALPWDKAGPLADRVADWPIVDVVDDAIMNFADKSMDLAENAMDRRADALDRASRRMFHAAH